MWMGKIEILRCQMHRYSSGVFFIYKVDERMLKQLSTNLPSIFAQLSINLPSVGGVIWVYGTLT